MGQTALAEGLAAKGMTLDPRERHRKPARLGTEQAEERAAKTAVKLIIPLVMFIFPALFVVLAGPAMMKLFETLTSMSGAL